MFELSVACKYLIPRWRQLSVSIISLVSTLVIALVVWLIVVFFSVKDGLENSWIDKIIALTAPVRITPTEKYYQSYYYLSDTISAHSDYTTKSIGEKLRATRTDPYDPDVDEEAPAHWTAPDYSQGELKDIVKLAYQAAATIPGLKGLKVSDFETTIANVRLRLLRNAAAQGHTSQQFLEHAAYVGSFDSDTKTISTALYTLSPADFTNLLHMQAVSSENIQEDSPDAIHRLEGESLQKRLQSYFAEVSVTALKAPAAGWRIPTAIYPEHARLEAAAVLKDKGIVRLIVPAQAEELPKLLQTLQNDGALAVAATVTFDGGKVKAEIAGQETQQLAAYVPIQLAGGTLIKATLVNESWKQAVSTADLRFTIHSDIQGTLLQGEIALGKLEIGEAALRGEEQQTVAAQHLPNRSGIALPINSTIGEAVLLPRSFREAGALVGDQGYLSYYSPTPSTVQEQRIPVFVAGFYDPGIIPIGGKYILAGRELTALIRASYSQEDALVSNGINVRFDNITEAPRVKHDIIKALEAAGIAPYWHVETYQEYEFTRDIVQQLRSEKNLFSLISLIIIIVACSNIISMLIILVNDKKLEIGILRSMGATSGSIAAIFGICGMVMGTMGSLIGIVGAILTLHNINALVGLVSRFQGYDLFNPVFYGNTLPSELSYEALTFVIATTAVISLLAGIVPAVKASMIRPSAILRAE